MSISIFVFVLLITIFILCLLTIKFKIHPVLVLFLCALFVALCSGNDLISAISLIKNNFGSTLGSIGTMIIFGSVIAVGIQETGAVTSMVNWFIKKFKGKNLELAPALEAFIMSIPVFGDIAIILNAPIAAIIAKRKNMSMTKIAPIINLGLTLTHGLVPPTPGILAVSIMLEADLGKVIIIGLVCSIISFIINYFTLCKLFDKKNEYIAPPTEYTENIVSVDDDSSIEKLLIDSNDSPNAFVSFLPLLLPALLISVGAIGKTFVDEKTILYSIFNIFSDGTVALFCGMVTIMIIATINKKGENRFTYFFSDCCNKWIIKALNISISPLMITAMGGAMGGILRMQPTINEIGNAIANTNFPSMLVPFVLAAVLMCVCGSMTTASLTSASLIAPIMGTLGLNPVCVAIAIGAGSMCFWHANNSGFWIFTSLYGFNTKQGYYYFTSINMFGGIIAFVTLILLNIIGIV